MRSLLLSAFLSLIFFSSAAAAQTWPAAPLACLPERAVIWPKSDSNPPEPCHCPPQNDYCPNFSTNLQPQDVVFTIRVAYRKWKDGTSSITKTYTGDTLFNGQNPILPQNFKMEDSYSAATQSKVKQKFQSDLYKYGKIAKSKDKDGDRKKNYIVLTDLKGAIARIDINVKVIAGSAANRTVSIEELTRDPSTTINFFRNHLKMPPSLITQCCDNGFCPPGMVPNNETVYIPLIGPEENAPDEHVQMHKDNKIRIIMSNKVPSTGEEGDPDALANNSEEVTIQGLRHKFVTRGNAEIIIEEDYEYDGGNSEEGEGHEWRYRNGPPYVFYREKTLYGIQESAKDENMYDVDFKIKTRSIIGEQEINTIMCEMGKDFSILRKGCVLEGTEIAKADGKKIKVEELKVGDKIVNKNGETTIVAINKFSQDKDVMYGINGGKPFITVEHPVLTTSGWKSLDPAITSIKSNLKLAGKLRVGDKLITRDGVTEVKSIEKHELSGGVNAYNISVEGEDGFIANDIVVQGFRDVQINY